MAASVTPRRGSSSVGGISSAASSSARGSETPAGDSASAASSSAGGSEPARVSEKLVPFDDINKTFIFDSCKEISISTLEDKAAFSMKLNFKYIDLVLLRIINPSNDVGGNMTAVYKRVKTGQSAPVKYKRLYLFKIHSNKFLEDSNRVVYMFVTKSCNIHLWGHNIHNRDNGNISIGSFMRLISPSPIEKYMSRDIPVLETRNPLILLKTPDEMLPMPMNKTISGNASSAFVCVGCQVNSWQQNVLSTSCSGKMCDRQRIKDWNAIKGCGCYGMLSNGTSLVVEHSIEVTCGDEVFRMPEFTSLKFNKLFMVGDFPFASKLAKFQMTEAFFDLTVSMDKCIDLINANGGFTVIGWYRRGEISDQSMVQVNDVETTGVGQKRQVDKYDNSDISYHFVHMKPTNSSFMDISHKLYTDLLSMKYNVSKSPSTDS